MGFRQPVRRSTLADANERRDWRIHAALAQRLITQARTLRRRRTGVGPDQYRLRPGLDDHRSVPVGLSVGALRGGEDAHAARPAGQHSGFIHISDGKLHDVCPRYTRSRSHLRRGSWLRRLCPPLCVAPSRGLLRHACQVEHRSWIRRRRIAIICDQNPLDTPVRITPNFCRRIRFKASPASHATSRSGRHHLRALQKPLARVDQAHLRIKQF